MDIHDKIKECSGFQWDRYNVQKNWEKHKVQPVESEQVFFNSPLIIVKDIRRFSLPFPDTFWVENEC